MQQPRVKGISGVNFTQVTAGTTTYSLHVPDPFVEETATLFPIKVHANIPPPDDITVPEPSNPGIAGSGLSMLYRPIKNARSDGFIGAASIFTRTSPFPGTGIGTSSTNISFTPLNTIAFIYMIIYYLCYHCKI